MLLLQCTRKVSKRFGLRLENVPETPIPTSLGVWYVNLLEDVWGYDFLLFVNNPTLYTLAVPIWDPKSPPNLESAFKQHLFSAWIAEGFHTDLVARKIAEYEPTIYAKTSSRRILGHLNSQTKNLYAYIEQAIDVYEGVVNLATIQQRLNRIPQQALDWNYAIEALRAHLKA